MARFPEDRKFGQVAPRAGADGVNSLRIIMVMFLIYKVPLTVNPDSERRLKRPKKRWLHNVENDLEYTGGRRWALMGSKMMAESREEMGSDFIQAKTLHGL